MTSVRGMSDLEIEGKFIHPGSQSSDFSVRQDSVRCVIKKSKGRKHGRQSKPHSKGSKNRQNGFKHANNYIILYMPAHPTISISIMFLRFSTATFVHVHI